jgi:hypothetical protein
MTRGIVLMIALSCSAWGQSIAVQKAFLRHVNALINPAKDAPPVDGVGLVQEEFGLTAESAEAVIATARAYDKEADRLDASMRRSILTRRLQVAGDFQVTYSSELDVVNWVNLDLNLFLLEQMEELAERLGEAEYAKVAQFMDWRGLLLNIPAGGTWTQSPDGFWRQSIKEPLTRPEADELFVRNFKDASLPPAGVVPFLEGTVVTVAQGDERGRRVLLSMQEGSPAEVALLIDGKEWRLKGQPQKGEVVRFSGTPIEFSREPFMILFRPERITGLVTESSEPNLPFTVPGLAR